jgi:hypothetical protein
LDSIVYYIYAISSINDEILIKKLEQQLLLTILVPLKKIRFYGIIFYIKNAAYFSKLIGEIKFLRINFNMITYLISRIAAKLFRAIR